MGTDGQTTCAKTIIPTGRDLGLAEWINIWYFTFYFTNKLLKCCSEQFRKMTQYLSTKKSIITYVGLAAINVKAFSYFGNQIVLTDP